MAITVQMQFASAVTELSEDACSGSSIANGTTIIQVDLRTHDVQQAVGTPATLCGRKASDQVEVHERSTLHHPSKDRFIVAPGASLNGQHPRVYFPPDLKGVSTAQHLSHRVLRWACSLAVVCGGRLRHSALLCAARFLRPLPKSSLKRWMDDMGTQLPIPEERRQQCLALAPATAGHRDGDYPLGPGHCVMVGTDEQDRILLTQAAAAEHGDEARRFLPRCTALGLQVTAAFSADSHSFTEARNAVSPQARWQADHGQTGKNIWGHLKKSRLS
jgi:hypothetical protein